MLYEWRASQSELSAPVSRHDGGAGVRFFDDMDLSDQRRLNSLHESMRDLNAAHRHLRQELEEERLRRTRFVSYSASLRK